LRNGLKIPFLGYDHFLCQRLGFMSAYLPSPDTAPALFSGVLARRTFAFFIDMFILLIGLITVAVFGTIFGVLTFGLGGFAVLLLLPVLLVAYYAVTLGSHRRATVGMQMMDIVLTPARGAPLNGPLIFAHTVLFWVTIWISLPVSLLFVLFTPRRQMLHDLLIGTLMVRRSPMERHWSSRPAGVLA
jgi:uncharacterized RDD family membrane protein YckC